MAYSRARTRAVLDALPVAVFITDAAGTIVLTNRAHDEITGVLPEAGAEPLAGFEIGAESSALSAAFVASLIEDDARNGQAGEADALVWHDGLRQYRVMRTILRRLPPSQALPFHEIGVQVDITETKRIEIDLKYSEDKLRGLFELSPLGIVRTSLNGAFLEFNAAFARICGYEPEELQRLQYWDLTPDRYAQAEQEQLTALMRTGHYGPYEKEYIRKDGTLVPLRLNGLLLRSNDGEAYIWSIVEDITAQVAAQAQISHHAQTDALTRLCNRRHLRERLATELTLTGQRRAGMALLKLDIDAFRDINDTFGHTRGDALLREAARRIEAVLDEDLAGGAFAGRVGGDEFIVVVPAVDDPLVVDTLAQRLQSVLAEPYVLETDRAWVSACIGIARHSGYDEQGRTIDADDLIRHADLALDEAKAQGRERICHFRRALQDAANRRGLIARELHDAVDRDQFHLVYQPIVALDSGAVVEAEALLRWHHPEFGLVSNLDFIPLAERTGTIQAIGAWVFDAVARQIAAWDRAGCPPLRVSINRSPVELRRPVHALEACTRALVRHGVAGDRIIVEITEGVLAELTDPVRDQLHRLRELGIDLALDDFGTGYCSMAYLKTFDVDFLKIDRSFVAGIAPGSDDLALCEAMIVMARKLGIEVIAEGIETVEQRDLLRAAGCRYGQGYFFARPMPADDFAMFVRREGMLA